MRAERLLDRREEAIIAVLVDGMLEEGGRTKNTRQQKKVIRIFIPMALYYFFSIGILKRAGFLRRGKGGGTGL
jgi:hypothetical protein